MGEIFTVACSPLLGRKSLPHMEKSVRLEDATETLLECATLLQLQGEVVWLCDKDWSCLVSWVEQDVVVFAWHC